MFEKFLHQAPFFRLVVPLVLGILFQINFQYAIFRVTAVLCILLFLIIILFHVFKLSRNYNLNKIWGLLISLLLFAFGVQLVHIKQRKEKTFNGNQQTFIATIIEQPEEKENSIKTIIKLDYLKDSSHCSNGKTKILCYFEKDSSTMILHLGDQILANAFINEIKHAGNPYSFNYKTYLKYKKIYNQCFIKSNNYTILEKNKGSKVHLFSNRIRQQLLNIYQENGIQEDEFAVLSALTLGYKSELTPELKESFSTSGAMHILAVSGLHVGVIYIILCKLLFFFQKLKYGKYIQSIIIILVLFFYAFLTGLSDSVFRATIMFSFISIGKMFTRQVNIYNSIAASAFILLFINPYSVMNVGFQLSYAAVLSIIFFQPKMYSLVSTRNIVLDYLWQLITVSIAAQIGTFPITMFYFGQFPLYFILTNILIIPIATIIIYSAFILFILSFSGWITKIIAILLNFITRLLNKSISFIENLPYSKVDQFLVDGYESLLWTIFILMISFFIISKRIKFLEFSLYLALLVFFYNVSITYFNSKKSIFIVHHINKTTGIHFIKNNQSQLFLNNDVDPNDTNLKYNISPVWRNLEICKDSRSINSVHKPLNFLQFESKKIVQLRQNALHNINSKKRLKVDYLILSDNIDISVNKLNDHFEFELIIFDSSNNYYQVRGWEKECIKNNIPFFNVLDKGAYIEYL